MKHKISKYCFDEDDDDDEYNNKHNQVNHAHILNFVHNFFLSVA
jgi:hypothetical protein